MKFSHEKLQVYKKILVFFNIIDKPINNWDKKHAFVDHLSRASESILLNLVEAVRQKKELKKLRSIDYSVGSTMECAACLDIAILKNLSSEKETNEIKYLLVEILKMLIGLRKSWEFSSEIAEEPSNEFYSMKRKTYIFQHESLDVYKLSLDYYRWFWEQDLGQVLPNPFAKKIDKYATSILLNIAEGNGRFSVLDQKNFLDIANSAAVKSSAFLDIGMVKKVWSTEQINEPKKMLVRVGQMTARKDSY